MYTDSFGNPIDPAGQGSYVVTNTFGNPTGGLYRGGYGQNWGQAYSNAYTPNSFVQSGYYNVGRPSFARALGNVAWGQDPQWGNPVDASQASIHSLASKPFDAAAWVTQNVAVPYAAYSGIGGAWMRTGATSPWGAAKAMWAGQGIGAGLGRGLVQGGLTGLGVGAGTASFMGGIGAMVGGLGGSLAIGYAATSAIDQALIQPYKFGRQNAENIRSAFANQYFGTGVGNPVTGKGFSGLAGAELGNTITRQGLQDWMFSREEYSNVAGMGMRAGLHDFGGQSKMADSIKNVAELVKLTVTIMKDPDTKKAIEQLAQLQLGGADLTSFAGGRTSTAGRALSQLNVFAAMGGTSVQNLMQTVGAQGQAIYQNAGLTPYLGQIAASNIYAGFAGAQRAGLIDPGTMARMGGIQGATSQVLGAQMTSTQNLAGQMQSYNRYITGIGGPNSGGSMSTLIANFNQGMSGNPLKAMGAMGLYGPQLQAAEISSQGNMGVERQLLMQARALGLRNPSVEELYSIGINMGYAPDQLRSYFNLRAAQQAPGAARQGYEAILGAGAEQMRAFANQTGLSSPISRNIGRPLGALKRKIGSYLSGPGEFINELQGGLEDVLTGANDWWSYSGVRKAVQVSDVENLFGEKTSDIGYFRNTNTSGSFNLKKNPFLDSRLVKIDKLAKSGDENAIAYLRATTEGERDKALNKLIKAGSLGEAGEGLDYNKAMLTDAVKARQDLETAAVKADRVYDQGIAAINAVDKGIIGTIGIGYGEDYMDKTFSNTERMKYLHMIGGASDLAEKISSGEISHKEAVALVKSDPRYSGILGRARQVAGGKGEAAVDENIREQIQNLERGGIDYGTGELSREVFKRVKKYGDIGNLSEDQQKAIMKQALKSTGGMLLTEGLNTGGGPFGLGGATREELNAIREMGKTTAGSMALATEAYQKSSVNYAAYSETLKKMGVNESDRFGAYVDNFGRKVDEMNGKGRDTSQDKLNKSQAEQMGKNMINALSPIPPGANQKTDLGSGAAGVLSNWLGGLRK